MSLYHNSEDLIQLGAYVAGSNPKLDTSLRCIPSIEQFLRQEPHYKASYEETAAQISSVALALSSGAVADRKS
jgi:flagellum-specific ATP synthase/type III secretion protein N (ATPase)